VAAFRGLELLMQKLAAVFILISFSCRAAHLTPQERLLAMAEGTFIEVRLHDKSKLHGRLDKVEAGGFLVTTPTANHLDLVQRRIAFSEVKTVKRVRDYQSGSDVSDKALIVIAILAFAIGPIVLAIGGDH
jgi:hypothetical protein